MTYGMHVVSIGISANCRIEDSTYKAHRIQLGVPSETCCLISSSHSLISRISAAQAMPISTATKTRPVGRKPQLRNEALEVLRNLFDFAEQDEGEPVFAEDDDLSANQPKPPAEDAPQE